MIKLKPVYNRVAIKISPKEIDTKTSGGIYLPEGVSIEKVCQKNGTVVAIGNGPDLDGNIAIGDRVLLPEYSGIVVTISCEDYTIIDYHELLAVLE